MEQAGSGTGARPSRRERGLVATVAAAITVSVLIWLLHHHKTGLVKTSLSGVRDILLAAAQVCAAVGLLLLIGLLIRWLSVGRTGTRILPFEVAAGENRYSGKALSDALLTEILRIREIHREIGAATGDAVLTPAATLGVSLKNLGVVPSQSFDATLNDVATVGLGGDTKLAVGSLLLVLKRLWPWGGTDAIVTGSVQRYGAVVRLVARWEQSDVQAWGVSKRVEADDQVADLVRDLAYKMLQTWPTGDTAGPASQNKVAQTWEGFKHYTEALNGYRHYNATGRDFDLERARTNALAAAQAEKGFSALFILFLHLSNAYVQRTNTLIGGESFSVTGGDRAVEDAAASARRENLAHAAEMARQGIGFSDQAESQPLYPWSWAMLGMANVIRAERTEVAKACAPIEKAVSLNPEDPTLHTLLAKVYTVAQDYDRALASARRAVEIAPKDYDAHYSLGAVLYYRGQYGGAVASLRQAIEMSDGNKATDPYSMEAHSYLAAAYRQLGREEEAQEEALTTHTLLVRRADVSEYDRATSEALAGNADEALKWLGIALRSRQKSADYAQAEPDLDSLRTDPRFPALLAACPAWPEDDSMHPSSTGAVPYRVI